MSPVSERILIALGFDLEAFKVIGAIDLDERELDSLIITKLDSLATGGGGGGEAGPDLTAIEALSGTGFLKRTGSNTWALLGIGISDVSALQTALDSKATQADIDSALVSISADKLTDGATIKAFLAAERTKLAGIATGATANSTDAQLRDRLYHTGQQAAATISDFAAAADARIALVVPPFEETAPLVNGIPVWSGSTYQVKSNAQVRTQLGLVIGTDVQAFSATLTTWAGKTAPSGTVVGTSDTQTLTNKTLTAPSISSPTGIVKGDVGLSNVDNTSDATKNSAAVTLTNKRIAKRVLSISSSATPTINTDSYDAVNITALAAAITSFTTNLTGTPNNFDTLEIRIKDDGTARALAFGASFAAKGAALPTTTVAGKHLNLVFKWHALSAVWGLVGSAQEA